MTDPVSEAVRGAGVGGVLAEVINATKKAWRCKGNCKKLESTLDCVEPYVKKMEEGGNDTCRTWLEDLRSLLEEAKRIIDKYCILKKPTLTSCSPFVYWKRSRVNSLILDIHDRIKEKIVEATKLILDLVQDVHDEVTTRKSPTIETPGFVSFENDTFEKLKTLVKTEGDGMGDPVTIGLTGARGAGKTLLAKMLYNDPDIQAKYGAHSILWITIGQDAKLPSLYLTMGKFLKDGVFERDYASRNEEDQRTYLITAFKKKKVLLILDDVWEQYSDENPTQLMMKQLDVAKGLGSVTLVTTQNDAVLTSAKAKETVVVPMLSESEAWKLFCYHAFAQCSPPQGQIAVVAKEICKECLGLPLALTVIGSTMNYVGSTKDYEKDYEEDLYKWRSALNTLKQPEEATTHVEERLFHRLKFSYDKLDDVKKKCFLYFAAFPEDAEIPTHQLCSIWQAEQLFVDYNDEKEASQPGMTTLIGLAKQSLIQLSKKDKIAKIHNVLRDLAIRIIREGKPGDWASECYFQPGKDLKTIPEFPSTIKRISLIGSMIQNFPDHFQVPQLQVLLLSRFNTRDREDKDIPLKFSKAFFGGMNNMLYLNMSQTSLEELPESIKEMKALKTLDLSLCTSLKKLPNLGIKELKALTSFKLRGCSSLEELPEGIKELKALTSLDLSGCSSLKKLPEGIKELRALTSLKLKGCSSLKKLPEGIKELKALTSLDLSGCSSLKKLPEGIKELKALTSLKLRGCSSLKKLPRGIEELKGVTTLNLSLCSSLEELPQGIKELKAFKTLKLSGCSSLKELPEGIKELKALKTLDLSGCSSLKKLPEGIKELKALRTLDLSMCSFFKEFPKDIKELNALETLKLSGWSSLKDLPEGIKELKALKTLDLSGCSSLKKLPEGIKELKALTSLNLSWCESLEELPESIEELKALTSLKLRGCSSLKKLPESMKELKALKTLKLSRCLSLKDLPEGIKELKSLKTLDLSVCPSLKEFPKGIKELKALTWLDLSGWSFLEELPEGIKELKALIWLGLSEWSSLKELPEDIKELKALETLQLSGCSSLKKLPKGIYELKALRVLDLSRCPNLEYVAESIKESKAWTCEVYWV